GFVTWHPLPVLPLLQKSQSSSSHFLRHIRRQQRLHRFIQQRIGEVHQLHSVGEYISLHIQCRGSLRILYHLSARNLHHIRKRIKPSRINKLQFGEGPPQHIHRKRDFPRLQKHVQCGHIDVDPRSRNPERDSRIPNHRLVLHLSPSRRRVPSLRRHNRRCCRC